jgi:AraC-like DNA-binding protein
MRPPASTSLTLPPAELQLALSDTRFESLFETTEPEQATAYVTSVYGPHALQLNGHADTLNMRLRGFEFAQLHLGEIRYGLPAVARMSQASGHWMFSYLRHGEVLDCAGRLARAGDGAVTGPDAVRQLHMSADAEILNLRVEPHDMAAACQSLLGSDLHHGIRFEGHALGGCAQVGALLRSISHLAATPSYAHPAARRMERNLRDAVLFELLLAWPNNYTHSLDTPAALPASTRRARDFIHAQAASNPSVADIAAAAGVGARALARGFDKHLGVSPLRYLQQVRLDRVRDALLAGGAATVTRVAMDWGFLQLGQFAASYRKRFGESPSETLRRARS